MAPAQSSTLRAAPVVIVMGVAGAGKTTIGTALAERLGCDFADGDSFHSGASIAKMRAGIPLQDQDRETWLRAIARRIVDWRAAGAGGIIACSVLKRAYRDLIIGASPDVRLVYLRGDRPLIAARLAERRDHFMPPSLLDSQFAALEEPDAEEDPIVLDASQPAPDLVTDILRALQRR